MSSIVSARLGVISPDTPIRAHMGGTSHLVPTIDFGEEFGEAEFSIVLNYRTLSPQEQAAWLRTLAEAASDLAIQVERANAEQVPA